MEVSWHKQDCGTLSDRECRKTEEHCLMSKVIQSELKRTCTRIIFSEVGFGRTQKAGPIKVEENEEEDQRRRNKEWKRKTDGGRATIAMDLNRVSLIFFFSLLETV